MFLPKRLSPFAPPEINPLLLSLSPLEQWSTAIGVRGDGLHHAGGRKRRDPIVHGAGARDSARGRTDRNKSHSSERHRQGWHLSKQSGEVLYSLQERTLSLILLLAH